MTKYDADYLKTIPPGHRRIRVALELKGLHQGHVAEHCFCDRSTVSRVVQGVNATQLHHLIRETIARLTGQPEAWLFEHGARCAEHKKAS